MQLLKSDSSGIRDGKMFYGHLLSSMRKVYDHPNIPTAAVNVTNKINLYINTEFFKSQTDEQRRDILEHECAHIIHYHIARAKELDPNDMMLWNMACDATINGPLESLHDMGVTVDKLRETIPDLEYNQSAEYYYKKLREYRDKNGGKEGEGESKLKESGKVIDDHSSWGKNDSLEESEEGQGGEGNIDEITKQMVKKALKDAIQRTEKAKGNVPMYVRKAYEELNRSNINWKQQLKQFFARVDKFAKKPTRKKLNRRYRHLNPGRRKDPMTHIAVGIDNSGSVGDALFHQFLSEIDAAARLDGIRFTIIQADCEVNSVIPYEPGMKLERTGRGGTAYMPAINKAIELKADGMIYFGDGDIFGEQLTQPKFPFLWAMEEGRQAPAEWGKVCHVEYPKEY